MSDSNRTGLSYVEETSWGVTPAAALKNLRFTGESLSFAKETTQSANIRSDRQKSAPVLTGFGVSGGYNFEFAAKELDDLMDDKSNWDCDIEWRLGKIYKMKGNFLGYRNELVIKKINKKDREEITQRLELDNEQI